VMRAARQRSQPATRVGGSESIGRLGPAGYPQSARMTWTATRRL